MITHSSFRKIAAFGVIRIFASSPMLGVKLRRVESAGALTILNFHRVDDRHVSSYGAISPRIFEELVGWLKSHFRIVTFRELGEMLPQGKPPLILSFDDGYRDFIDIVASILDRHGVIANQNVIPRCVETGEPPINIILQDFIGQAPASLLKEVAIPGLGSPLDADNRPGSGLRASAALKTRPIAEQKKIYANLKPLMERLSSLRTAPMMTRDEVRQIAAMHEIGAHSFEHASMAFETDEYLAQDAARCRSWFGNNLGVMPSIYAFPNGSRRPGQGDILRRAGYAHILLVDEAFSRSSNWQHPRFTMHGQGAAELRWRALGAFANPDMPRTAKSESC